jgi:hypothetical protein
MHALRNLVYLKPMDALIGMVMASRMQRIPALMNLDLLTTAVLNPLMATGMGIVFQTVKTDARTCQVYLRLQAARMLIVMVYAMVKMTVPKSLGHQRMMDAHYQKEVLLAVDRVMRLSTRMAMAHLIHWIPAPSNQGLLNMTAVPIPMATESLIGGIVAPTNPARQKE